MGFWILITGNVIAAEQSIRILPLFVRIAKNLRFQDCNEQVGFAEGVESRAQKPKYAANACARGVKLIKNTHLIVKSWQPSQMSWTLQSLKTNSLKLSNECIDLWSDLLHIKLSRKRSEMMLGNVWSVVMLISILRYIAYSVRKWKMDPSQDVSIGSVICVILPT